MSIFEFISICKKGRKIGQLELTKLGKRKDVKEEEDEKVAKLVSENRHKRNSIG